MFNNAENHLVCAQECLEVLSSIPIEMPIEEVVDTIINDVEDYTTDEEQDDDITLVAVRVA